ncbi:TonB-dependent receptor [Rhodopseudomonas palustris]|uniref:TonB-dependent receptor n=1 Tax=Rhodopseudomonas palustris TaxID=1076 RepID=A0AAX3DXY4_RHOPL|nr:TonB-dependent receptor [Rhodopseudomonas palustris]UYO39695.1 TonB-dependent receptor [Rhodopseudomonas palustris]
MQSRPAAPRPCSAVSRALLASTILVPALSLTTPAAAQDVLPEIVVSATATETPREQVASSVTVITADDIQREQRRTVTEALSTVPGLNVVQSGGPGSTTSIFMRGTASNHVKVLVDGIDIGDPSGTNGAPDISQLLTSDIARIEVLRGPQSGLYGSDAIGGVISITTKKGDGAPKVRASVEGGSFGTFNQTAGFSGAQNNFNYSVNVAHLQATSTPSVPWRYVPPGGQRINEYYDNKTISARLGYDFDENFSVSWISRYSDSDYRFPPSNPTVQESSAPKQFLTRGEAVWTAFDGRLKNYFGIDYTDLSRWFTNYSYSDVPSNYKGQRVKYDWRSVVQALPGQTLVIGADKQTDYFQNDNNKIDVSNGNKGAYAELQSTFAERFFVVSNIRHDENDAFGGHDTFRIAPAVLLPNTETKLKASYGTGFKAPSLDQLYGNYPLFNFFGNPNLRPEESKGWDAGFEQPIAGDQLRFGVTYFHNDIKNLIATDPSFTTLINVNQARTRGIEAFGSWTVTSQLKLRADYTYTEAFDSITEKQLSRRPRNKASLSASWTPTDQWRVSGTVLYVGEWFDQDRVGFAAPVWAPGYTVVNIAAEYKATEQMTIFGRVDNLFDKHYENPYGYLKTGIGAFAGIRVSSL